MSRWDRKEKGPAKDAAVIAQLEGTSFPVEVAYLQKATADYVKMAVTVIFDIHLKVRPYITQPGQTLYLISESQMPPGDILVFLTGREEIDRCVQQIADELIQ
jgi:ATP-dependent RNA helicase DDX35